MLKINSLSKTYGKKIIFDKFDLSVKQGQFIALMGANGIGKTTLLNLLAGLISPDSGDISVANRSNRSRDVSYMMQNHHDGLFPWFKVWENIALPLKFKGIPEKKRYLAVIELMSRYSINLPLSCYPYQLSGGQKQLTLLLQSIISKPSLILMDEPFSALDLITSKKIQTKLVEMWQAEKPTIIYISHRIEDAIYLANRVVVMSADPARIILDLENSLPYPRETGVIGNKEFSKLYKHLERVIANL
ncbi:MAG: ABC transporter ATP-binding protein [bacterium]